MERQALRKLIALWFEEDIRDGTRNGGAIKETTEVIDSYILGQIKGAGINSFGYTAASSLFQSVVGLLMMLLANFTVRKIEPDNALF